jgi:hypothetical protein
LSLTRGPCCTPHTPSMVVCRKRRWLGKRGMEFERTCDMAPCWVLWPCATWCRPTTIFELTDVAPSPLPPFHTRARCTLVGDDNSHFLTPRSLLPCFSWRRRWTQKGSSPSSRESEKVHSAKCSRGKQRNAKHTHVPQHPHHNTLDGQPVALPTHGRQRYLTGIGQL